ncbi:MAG: hypothetical protein IJ576_04890 [Synergistaceae bacterium]|nr:hypothetical protein [Synergistaceae bacterium]MBR1602817.1 hypothetical protein [Synergistaceae bacterium]
MNNEKDLLEAGKKLLRTEAGELLKTADNIGAELVQAAKLIYSCKGRVVIAGLGSASGSSWPRDGEFY